MISRGEAISFCLISLVLANILLFKGFSKVRPQITEEGVYRYSKYFSKFFLFMTLVWTGMAFIIGFSGSAPPQGNGLIAFSAVAIAMVGFPVLGYVYVERYRVTVEQRGVTVTSLFKARFIAFADIAAIATMSGRGKDYWLFSRTGECMARIGGSIENFSSLQYDVELGTRSKDVMLYDFEILRGWRERVDDPDDDWRTSKGPPLIRDRNRRVTIEMVIGGLLVGMLVACIHFCLR